MPRAKDAEHLFAVDDIKKAMKKHLQLNEFIKKEDAYKIIEKLKRDIFEKPSEEEEDVADPKRSDVLSETEISGAEIVSNGAEFKMQQKRFRKTSRTHAEAKEPCENVPNLVEQTLIIRKELEALNNYTISVIYDNSRRFSQDETSIYSHVKHESLKSSTAKIGPSKGDKTAEGNPDCISSINQQSEKLVEETKKIRNAKKSANRKLEVKPGVSDLSNQKALLSLVDETIKINERTEKLTEHTEELTEVKKHLPESIKNNTQDANKSNEIGTETEECCNANQKIINQHILEYYANAAKLAERGRLWLEHRDRESNDERAYRQKEINNMTFKKSETSFAMNYPKQQEPHYLLHCKRPDRKEVAPKHQKNLRLPPYSVGMFIPSDMA